MRIVGKKTERKTNISLFPADIHTYKVTFFYCTFPSFDILTLTIMTFADPMGGVQFEEWVWPQADS